MTKHTFADLLVLAFLMGLLKRDRIWHGS